MKASIELHERAVVIHGWINYFQSRVGSFSFTHCDLSHHLFQPKSLIQVFVMQIL